MKPEIENAIGVLQSATRMLSSVCDGASTLDGAGFNGVDTNFGKSLARQDKWSPKQAVAAQKMLRKYAGQLHGFGIEIADLPALAYEELMEGKTKVNQIDFNTETQAFEFWFDYDFEQKEFLKTYLKAFYRSDGRGHYWNLTAARADMDGLTAYMEHYKPVLTAAAQNQLIRTTEVENVANVAQVASVELSKAEDADLSAYDLTGFGLTPYPFQKAGALYGLLKKRVLIGDDMGLGKTIQALMIAFLSGAADKFIVVCPASVKINWQREATRAIPGLTSSIWNGKAGDSDVNLIIINYDNLKKQLPKLKAFGAKMLIVDEVHYIKSRTAQRTQACLELGADVEYIAELSGTPILSRPSELIPPLELIGRLDEFGGWFQFAQRYCAAHHKMIWVKRKGGKAFQKRILDISGSSNLQELNDKLRQSCMVRRKKADVLKDLPAKIRSQVVLPITNRKEYDSAQANLIAFVQAIAAEDKAFLAGLKHMDPAARQAAIEDRQNEVAGNAERAEQLVMVNTLKQLAAKGKMSAMIEWVEDVLETGEKLILFATHVAIQHEFLKAFPGRSARIIAEDSTTLRQAAVDRFRSEPDCRLIVCSLIAGGQGVDGMQDACSNVAFAELGWTPAEHLQAEDRAHRIGQDDQVTCHYLIAENTIEEAIQGMLAYKQAVCESALDGASELREGSIFNELIEAIQA